MLLACRALVSVTVTGMLRSVAAAVTGSDGDHQAVLGGGDLGDRRGAEVELLGRGRGSCAASLSAAPPAASGAAPRGAYSLDRAAALRAEVS